MTRASSKQDDLILEAGDFSFEQLDRITKWHESVIKHAYISRKEVLEVIKEAKVRVYIPEGEHSMIDLAHMGAESCRTAILRKLGLNKENT